MSAYSKTTRSLSMENTEISVYRYIARATPVRSQRCSFRGETHRSPPAIRRSLFAHTEKCLVKCSRRTHCAKSMQGPAIIAHLFLTLPASKGAPHPIHCWVQHPATEKSSVHVQNRGALSGESTAKCNMLTGIYRSACCILVGLRSVNIEPTSHNHDGTVTTTVVCKHIRPPARLSST